VSAPPDTGTPAVSVLITNWNGGEVLCECLRSVRDQTHGIAYEVILVDDASTDGSAEMIRREFEWVRLVARTENGGFVRANNDGARHARGRYLFLLNSDTILVTNAVRILADYLDTTPEAGICGGYLCYPDNAPQVSFGDAPSLLEAATDALFLNDLFPRGGLPSRGALPRPERTIPFSVGYVSGADLMIRREFVERHGLFDERYEAYCEEVDLCRRMRITGGLDVRVVPQARIIHLGGFSYSKQGERHIRTQYQSYDRYLKKHHGPWYARAVRALYAWHYAVKWCVRRARRGGASGDAAARCHREEERARAIVRYSLRPFGKSGGA
jgi:GT2 family glycosyltransferase